MDYKTITIPVDKIISSTDRKYGGEGSIETLAQSMKEYGIIHPIAVKESTDEKGFYKVIAGRRRYEAAKFLGWKNIEGHVYSNKTDDEAIALAENVNREDLHPLDEAVKFKHQLESGKFKSIEEMAKYYARSVSGIHHRIRLTNLIDGIKTMFRDGKINLSCAALIASLPEEDQEKFLKKFEKKSVGHWEVDTFFNQAQKFKLEHIDDKECEACKKRTHNTTPGLFEDYSSLTDVCFDGECYAEKWKRLIARLIAESGQDNPTDNVLFLNRGVPKFFPKGAKSIKIDDIEYTLLSENDYTLNEKTTQKSKKQTAWSIGDVWESGGYKFKTLRVVYKKREKIDYRTNSAPPDPVKELMIDHLPEIKPEDKQAVAEEVKKKIGYSWNFLAGVKKHLLDMIITKRLKEESRENMAAIYLTAKCSGVDNKQKWYEIAPENRKIFTAIFGDTMPLSDIPKDPWVQKIFLFLIAINLVTNNMPDLKADDEEWERLERSHSLFWKFAQMTREEYVEMYRDILTAAIKGKLEETGNDADEQQGDDDDDDPDMEESQDDMDDE